MKEEVKHFCFLRATFRANNGEKKIKEKRELVHCHPYCRSVGRLMKRNFQFHCEPSQFCLFMLDFLLFDFLVSHPTKRLLRVDVKCQ